MSRAVEKSHKIAKNLCERDALPTELYPQIPRAKVSRSRAIQQVEKGWPAHGGCIQRPHPGVAQSQRPITRSEGSLIKTPGVVSRPVSSISRRSIIRTGETVVVPIGRNLRRFGISEPVTKTVLSSTFSFRSEVWLAGVPANMLVAMRAVALSDMSVFTSEITPARPWCKLSNCRRPD